MYAYTYKCTQCWLVSLAAPKLVYIALQAYYMYMYTIHACTCNRYVSAVKKRTCHRHAYERTCKCTGVEHVQYIHVHIVHKSTRNQNATTFKTTVQYSTIYTWRDCASTRAYRLHTGPAQKRVRKSVATTTTANTQHATIDKNAAHARNKRRPRGKSAAHAGHWQ